VTGLPAPALFDVEVVVEASVLAAVGVPEPSSLFAGSPQWVRLAVRPIKVRTTRALSQVLRSKLLRIGPERSLGRRCLQRVGEERKGAFGAHLEGSGSKRERG